MAAMAPTTSASVWPLIFQFLEPEDLVSVSAVCFSWWQFVFRCASPITTALRNCEKIDLANTGNLYKKVPLKFFTRMTSINLRGTTISTKDFLKLANAARRLRVLDIESCAEISESAISKAKDSLRYLTNINVSYNVQFTLRYCYYVTLSLLRYCLSLLVSYNARHMCQRIDTRRERNPVSIQDLS